MVDTFTLTTNKNIKKPDYNQYVNNWNTPVNADWDVIDKALGGYTPKTLSGSDIYLTRDECQAQRIVLNGALLANITIYIPFQEGSTTAAIGGAWIVINNTSGAFTVTFKTAVAGSQGVTADQSVTSFIYSDWVNCAYADSRATANVPTGGGTDKVFYLNDQVITTDYSIPSAKNAMTAGPISINGGVTVTVTPPSVWSII